MNVVDSSAWLEYFADGPNAGFFAPAIEATERLIVPSVVELDASLALSAARLGLESKLPLADSIVLATARRFDAVLWTQDGDFEGLPNVRYRARKP